MFTSKQGNDSHKCTSSVKTAVMEYGMLKVKQDTYKRIHRYISQKYLDTDEKLVVDDVIREAMDCLEKKKNTASC
jgi:hypothetical protein